MSWMGGNTQRAHQQISPQMSRPLFPREKDSPCLTLGMAWHGTGTQRSRIGESSSRPPSSFLVHNIAKYLPQAATTQTRRHIRPPSPSLRYAAVCLNCLLFVLSFFPGSVETRKRPTIGIGDGSNMHRQQQGSSPIVKMSGAATRLATLLQACSGYAR